jgi:hypothetical protein
VCIFRLLEISESPLPRHADSLRRCSELWISGPTYSTTLLSVLLNTLLLDQLGQLLQFRVNLHARPP